MTHYMQIGDAISAIKERLSIVDVVKRYVDLKLDDNRWVALCPFHQETNPSFSVNTELGIFHCSGCQASGDIFEFYGKINGLEFKECVEQLAQEVGLPLTRASENGLKPRGTNVGELTLISCQCLVEPVHNFIM